MIHRIPSKWFRERRKRKREKVKNVEYYLICNIHGAAYLSRVPSTHFQSGEKFDDETSHLKRWFLKNSLRIFVAVTIRRQLHPRPVTCFPRVTREAVPKVRVHDSTTVVPKMFLSLFKRERYAFSLSFPKEREEKGRGYSRKWYKAGCLDVGGE